MCVAVWASHLVGLSEVVYCTAALPTDGHYHIVAISTQGWDFSHFQMQKPQPQTNTTISVLSLTSIMKNCKCSPPNGKKRDTFMALRYL